MLRGNLSPSDGRFQLQFYLKGSFLLGAYATQHKQIDPKAGIGSHELIISKIIE
jgi:hypothetical protein